MRRRAIAISVSAVVLVAAAAALPAPALTYSASAEREHGLRGWLWGPGYFGYVDGFDRDSASVDGLASTRTVAGCAWLQGTTTIVSGCGDLALVSVDPLLTSGRLVGSLPTGGGLLVVDVSVTGTGGYALTATGYIPVPGVVWTGAGTMVSRSGPAGGSMFHNVIGGASGMTGNGTLFQGSSLSASGSL